MPLSKGCSSKSFQKNVQQLIEEGKSREQAVAIAHSVQRKSCGIWIFNYGYAPLEEMASWLDLGELRLVKSGVATNQRLGSFGGLPGPVRSNGDSLHGFLLRGYKRDTDEILEQLGPKWKWRSITVHSGNKQKYLAITFVPKSTKHRAPSAALIRKTEAVLAPFWDFSQG